MRVRTFTILLAAAVLSATLLTGCNVSPDKSPAFIKLSNRVDALEDSQKKAESSIKGLYIDVSTIDEDLQGAKARMSTISQNPQQDERLSAATAKIDQLEKNLQAMQAAMKAQEKEFEKKLSGARSPARVSSAPPATSSSKTRRTASAPAAKPEPKKPEPTGFYYKVKSGDTLQKIGQRYNVSSAEICRANRLPLTATILAGQQIYIPRGKG